MSLLLGQDERKWLFALVSTDKVGRMHYSTHKAALARALWATDGLFKQRAVWTILVLHIPCINQPFS